jgi:hypothetical protein
VRAVTTLALASALALASRAGHAQPAGSRMQYVAGETIHLANQAGAINRHDEASVEIELRGRHQVIVRDSGARAEHNLYRTFSTADKVTWSNRWTGTWKRDRAGLALSLELADRTCTRVKTTSGGPPETLACGTVDRRVRLACTSEQLVVETAAGSSAKAAAWRCSPVAGALAETPVPWVVGQSGCVRVVGSRRGKPTYGTCTP